MGIIFKEGWQRKWEEIKFNDNEGREALLQALQ
jgi:hypothetical protein